MRDQRHHAWHVRRSSVSTPTSQQRWDRAYQLLLQWAMTSPEPAEAPGAPILPEVLDADSNLRPCLDQPPGRPPDHYLDAHGVPTPSGTPRWSSPTIRGILRNPTYTGQIYAQRTRYRAPTHRRSATHPIGRPHGSAVPQPADSWIPVGPVPAMVSRVHFDEVQAKLATNRSFARRNNTAHRYLLRALVSCGCCGLACTARAINGRNFYYLCSGKGHSTFSHRATCCRARHTPANQLDALVWNDLCSLLGSPEPLAAAVARAHGGAWLPQELLARRETLRRAQAHLSQQIERLTDAYAGGPAAR